MSASPSATLLDIQQVAYQYRQAPTPSLNGISLSIAAGEIFGLLGPNGAGKTTLISLISGLLPLQQGDIRYEGQALETARRAQASVVALVPQENAVYPMLTVQENLAFFAGVQGIHGALARERTAQALAFCQLEPMARKLASQLSGGLRRRLNLAIGLLGDPRLLLLDEPTVGVDPQSRHFLLESIAALRERGVTVIYTSHYMDEVEALCDRVAIIDHGQVLVQGTLEDIAALDSDHLELRLRSSLSEALCTQWGLKALNPGHYEGRRPASTLPELLSALQREGGELLSVNQGRQDLEQVFMRLTRRSLRD
jgi:ABC-2 type transport system ATP-binding protein